MAYNGWFPCFSPSGAHVVTGTGDLWFDGTQQIGFGYQARSGSNSIWTSEDTILYTSTPTPQTDSGYGLWTVKLGGTPQNLNILGAFYELVVAQNGRWAGWAPASIRTSWGETIGPGAGRPTITSTHLAYTLDYNANVQRLMLDGVQIDSAPITNLQMSTTALCWTRLSGALGRDVWGVRLDVADTPSSQAASPLAEFVASPIDTPTGPWILSYDSQRLILRPWDEDSGYVVKTGETMYPAGVFIASTGNFRIGWSSSSGVYTEASIDPSANRVNLLTGVDEGPPPPETDPGNPGSTAALSVTSSYPPIRQAMVDAKTGLVTKPWARWFEAQATGTSSNVWANVHDSRLLGRGSSGAGPASVLTPGTGLRIVDTTVSVTLTDLLAGAIQYGTRASQPAASTVPVGTLYGISDEAKIERSNGTTWDPFGPA